MGAKLDDLLARGLASFELVAASELRELYNNDQLVFKEDKIYGGHIEQNIQLPLDPSQSGKNPIIFVQDEEQTWILNGNHRTFAVIDYDSNPSDEGLCVLRLGTPEAFKALTGLQMTSEGVTFPEFLEGDHR